jgi:hypothetical protein
VLLAVGMDAHSRAPQLNPDIDPNVKKQILDKV